MVSCRRTIMSSFTMACIGAEWIGESATKRARCCNYGLEAVITIGGSGGGSAVLVGKDLE